MTSRVCSHCKVDRPIAEFVSQRGVANITCRLCRDRKGEWYRTHSAALGTHRRCAMPQCSASVLPGKAVCFSHDDDDKPAGNAPLLIDHALSCNWCGSLEWPAWLRTTQHRVRLIRTAGWIPRCPQCNGPREIQELASSAPGHRGVLSVANWPKLQDG